VAEREPTRFAIRGKLKEETTAVTQRGLRAVTVAGAAMVLAMVSGACVTTEQPTPIYVYITPTPTPASAAPTEVASETPFASFTPWPSGSPTPEPTPTPTPAPTSTPAAPPTGTCTGSASNLLFLQDAANGVKFTVYCAVGLPSGWAIASGSWAGSKSGGTVTVTYKYKNTSTTVTITEGAFCLTGPGPCSPNTGLVGAADFGGMAGNMYSTTTGFAVYVAPGTTHAYQAVSTGLSSASLASVAHNMVAVPKT
jgi:hypothetical protein